MGFHFTPNQERVIQDAVNWYLHSPEQVFQISGNPGTGKSVVLNEIIRRLQLPLDKVAPMAYTGAASVVMRMKGLISARTIHSWLFQPVEVPVKDENGRVKIHPYYKTPIIKIEFVPVDLSYIKLIVIDEAGSVPMNLKQHIRNTGAKVLVAGDLDQLPPVADNPAFLYNGKVHWLTDIMRQAEGNPIIYLSQRAKNGLPIHLGNYGNVLVIAADDITDEMYMASPVILCGRNNTRNVLTNHIRHDLYHMEGTLPNQYEKVICRRNNWNIEECGINLTNGLTGIVINQPSVRGFDGKNFIMDFKPEVDPTITFSKLKCSYEYLIADRDQRNNIKKMPHVRSNLFEFGYALTVHLSQGSQWRGGMYYEEYMNPEINNKLNYTALTRFSEMCIYVKPKRKYY